MWTRMPGLAGRGWARCAGGVGGGANPQKSLCWSNFAGGWVG